MIGKIILLHAIGDYMLQWESLAIKKKESNACALLHAFLYTLPFLLITLSFPALFTIFFTHFLIDRFDIVAKLDKYLWKSNKTWLNIVRDNILHILIDYLSVVYL